MQHANDVTRCYITPPSGHPRHYASAPSPPPRQFLVHTLSAQISSISSEFLSLSLQARARQSPFAFCRAVPEGVSVSADGLAVYRVGTAGWQNDSALVEPAFSSAERCYAEWVIVEADADCHIMIGVTDLDAAPPDGKCMYNKPGSRMYYCHDSRAFPGKRDWGATGQRARGDRVGLLVERGGVSVYVNGARLGPGPMATDLPQRVHHASPCLPLSCKRWRTHARFVRTNDSLRVP
jgi:hypothetical protein